MLANISENLTKDQLDALSNWILALPPNLGMELEGGFPTRSTCIILFSAYAVWSKLAGMDGYALITEAMGPSMLAKSQGSGTPHASTKSSAPSKENMPIINLTARRPNV